MIETTSVFLLQNLSTDDASFGQRWWGQKWNKGQHWSRPVTAATGVNELKIRRVWAYHISHEIGREVRFSIMFWTVISRNWWTKTPLNPPVRASMPLFTFNTHFFVTKTSSAKQHFKICIGNRDSMAKNLSQKQIKNTTLGRFAPIVTAHPYCASNFTCHVMHRARAKH